MLEPLLLRFPFTIICLRIFLIGSNVRLLDILYYFIKFKLNRNWKKFPIIRSFHRTLLGRRYLFTLVQVLIKELLLN